MFCFFFSFASSLIFPTRGKSFFPSLSCDGAKHWSYLQREMISFVQKHTIMKLIWKKEQFRREISFFVCAGAVRVDESFMRKKCTCWWASGVAEAAWISHFDDSKRVFHQKSNTMIFRLDFHEKLNELCVRTFIPSRCSELTQFVKKPFCVGSYEKEKEFNELQSLKCFPTLF